MSTPAFNPDDWITGKSIMEQPLMPIDWLIEDVLPAGTVGDIYAPPGAGKSSLLLSLIAHIVERKSSWFGRALPSNPGPVLILGGEKSNPSVWRQDFVRAQMTGSDRIIIQPSEYPPMLQWRGARWAHTYARTHVLKMAERVKPSLIVIDTLSRIALGSNPIDITQQQMLALELENVQRDSSAAAGNAVTVITVSHTNQQSRHGSISSRLDWYARSGGSGLPGHLRWLMGLTPIRDEDELKALHLKTDQGGSKFFAVAVSKPSEMTPPVWSPDHPAIFEMGYDGVINLVQDASNKHRQQAATKSSSQPPAIYEDWAGVKPATAGTEDDDFC